MVFLEDSAACLYAGFLATEGHSLFIICQLHPHIFIFLKTHKTHYNCWLNRSHTLFHQTVVWKTNITSMSYSHNMLVIIRHTKNKSEHNRWRIALSHALAHGRPAAHWSQFSLPSQVLRNLSDCIFHILGETHLDAVRPNDMTCESCVIYLWYTCCYVTIRYLYLI